MRDTRARSDGAHVAGVREPFARSWPAELADSPGQPDGIGPEDLLPFCVQCSAYTPQTTEGNSPMATIDKRKPTRSASLSRARQRRRKDLLLEPPGKKPAGRELKVVGRSRPLRPSASTIASIELAISTKVAPASLVGRRIKFTKEGTS